MKRQTYVIVGDDYKTFAKNPNVLTASALLADPRHDWDGEIIIGQGISEEQHARIKEKLETCTVENVRHWEPLAPVQLTHKCTRDNVLISAPKKLTPQLYLYNLALNEKNDRLSDHVTGQHVGAMLLMEAARQAVIATLEHEYSQNCSTKLGFILERFDSQFDGYVFPLPTPMLVTLVEHDGRSDKQISTTLTIEFQQNGEKICEMALHVTLYPSALLEKVEARKARKVLESLCQDDVEVPALLSDAGVV